MPNNVLPLHLKQTFPPKIWIFAEGEGDGIKSRLPFKIFYFRYIYNDMKLWVKKLHYINLAPFQLYKWVHATAQV